MFSVASPQVASQLLGKLSTVVQRDEPYVVLARALEGGRPSDRAPRRAHDGRRQRQRKRNPTTDWRRSQQCNLNPLGILRRVSWAWRNGNASLVSWRRCRAEHNAAILRQAAGADA